jgi:2-polyprenyl-3-methyl-5-hydroxy-6-metoxy-1,4-benzoquinol methylase
LIPPAQPQGGSLRSSLALNCGVDYNIWPMRRAIDDPPESQQYYVLTDANAIRRRWHLNKLGLMRLTAITAEDQVLDAGCGAGNLVSELAPLCGGAIGCDYRYPCLAVASRRGTGSYVQADLQQLPFPAKTFGTIFCMEVIEHLDRGITAQALAEFHRVLRPQGQFLLTTPNYRSLWVAIEFLADTVRLVPEMVGGEHISKYHRRTLAALLTEAGFVIERIGTFNHLSPFIALLSERWAERLYHWEIKEGRPGGNLLYAVCRKP